MYTFWLPKPDNVHKILIYGLFYYKIEKIRNGFAKAMQYDKVDRIDKTMVSYRMNISDKNTMDLIKKPDLEKNNECMQSSIKKR